MTSRSLWERTGRRTFSPVIVPRHPSCLKIPPRPVQIHFQSSQNSIDDSRLGNSLVFCRSDHTRGGQASRSRSLRPACGTPIREDGVGTLEANALTGILHRTVPLGRVEANSPPLSALSSTWVRRGREGLNILPFGKSSPTRRFSQRMIEPVFLFDYLR